MFRPADDDAPTTTPWGRLAAVLLVALVLRLGLAFALPADIDALPDQGEYLQLARSLLDGDGLALVDERYATPQTLLAYRAPGYPAFVAALGANVTAVRVGQALLDTSTALATFLLARRWLGDGPGLFAALLVALNPFLAYFSTLILSETLYTALLMWGLVGVARVGRRGGGWWWAGMVLLALSCLVRPSGIGLAVVLGIASAFLPGRHPFAVHSRWPIPAGFTSILVVGVVLLPWAVRNWYALGTPVFTTTNGGITLYDGWNVDNTTGGSDQSFVRTMPQLGLMNEVERSSYLRERAVEAVREQPGRAVVLALKKAARTWSPVPLSERGNALYWTVGLAYCVPLFGLVSLGLLSDLPRSAKALLVLPALYLTLVHMLSVGSLRYRLPADPQLAVLAAAGAAGLWNARRSRPRRVFRDDEPDDVERGFEVLPPDRP